jgi:epoxyqueuosine reductase
MTALTRGLVESLAREVGFDLVGIAAPDASRWGDAYRQWVAAGKHGRMDYLAKNLDDRLEPQRRFPWLKSVICVGLAYWTGAETGKPAAEPLGSVAPEGKATAKIARYAWGRDYHKVVTKKLETLEKRLRKAIDVPFDARIYVDTGPLLEREFALRAGLGWIGKHTLLIHPKHGSFFVLGEMLTSLELPFDTAMTDHCGTCTRCIQACPTEAITPYSVDATKCISYQTLENRGDLPAELNEAMAAANFLIGCDICQDVCPFNRAPLPTREADFAPQAPAPLVSLPQVQALDEHEWDKLTRGKAHRRAKLFMWQRNAGILAGDDVNTKARSHEGPRRT